jgi:hypothetical protein
MKLNTQKEVVTNNRAEQNKRSMKRRGRVANRIRF